MDWRNRAYVELEIDIDVCTDKVLVLQGTLTNLTRYELQI